MRAERSRGSRIRSQSSRNELINENIRQASPALPGFLFFVGFGTAGLGLRSSDRTRISTVVCPLYAGRRAYKARDDRDDIFAGY
jgi:hypothetical protein